MISGYESTLERLNCRVEFELELRPVEQAYLTLSRLRETTKLVMEDLTQLNQSDIIDVGLVKANLQDVMDEYRDCIRELHKSVSDPL